MTRAERREHRKLRKFINQAAREVERWPAWMMGKPNPKPTVHRSPKESP